MKEEEIRKAGIKILGQFTMIRTGYMFLEGWRKVLNEIHNKVEEYKEQERC